MEDTFIETIALTVCCQMVLETRAMKYQETSESHRCQ